jgi:hypothetical protein
MRDTSWIKRSYPDLADAPLSAARASFGKAALDKAS